MTDMSILIANDNYFFDYKNEEKFLQEIYLDNLFKLVVHINKKQITNRNLYNAALEKLKTHYSSTCTLTPKNVNVDFFKQTFN